MFESIVLAVLAIPVLAIVAIVMAAGARERIKRLERRIGVLEARLGRIAEEAPFAGEPPQLRPAAAAPPPETIAAPSPAEPSRAEPIPAAPQPPPPLKPAKPKIGLEERFGTQWVVWAGGIALVLGGFFLVRYSIEQGWFGPAQRVVLGAIVALALIAAGEWTRRREIVSGVVSLPKAHIPSVLTAAGTAVAYADVYAAYALYGFIGPAVAFVLLGLVALGTLAAALLHGPALAGLGVIGGFVTPLIVSSEEPSYWALYLYLAVVTAAAFGLARAQLWRWLALSAIVASALWALPGIGNPQALVPHVFHIAAGFALATLLIVSDLIFGPDAAKGRIDFVSSFALIAYLVAATLLVVATGHDELALILFVVLVVATLAIASRSDAAVGAVPVAAILVAVVFAQWSLDLDPSEFGLPLGTGPDSPWQPDRLLFGAPLTLGTAFALLFGLSGFLIQGRETRPRISILWSASAALAPIVILIALYWRIEGFDRSVPFAGAALALAAAFGFATEVLGRRGDRAGVQASGAIFATGAIASLALALSLALEKGWLSIALALMVPGIAWVASKRPWPALRWLAAAVTFAVLGRVSWDPRIVGVALGETPIFNWLLYGYGVPAAAFWIAGHILRRRGDDVPARIVDAAAILFTVLLIVFEVRHYLTGDPFATTSPLAETGLDLCLLLALMIGLERLRLKSGSVIHDWGAQILAAVALVTAAFRLGIGDNPLMTGEPVGGRFVNLVLLAYAVPAILAGVLAYLTRKTRPRHYVLVATVSALALALGYVSLEIRRLYQGPVLLGGITSDAELYTYSAVWLAFGVVLLAAGVWFRSLPLRIASAAFVTLTVLKVFLVDMSDLTGIYRALSFLGLGAVLIGIGWFYQRLLFPRGQAPTDPERSQGA